MTTPLKVFISYSQNKSDRQLLDQLLSQTAPLVKSGKIIVWEDSKIPAGQQWDKAIKDSIAQADIVVLLVSSDYTASEYINTIEVPLAMERQAAGHCAIVPVLLRSCLFELMPYSHYAFLPKSLDSQRLIPVDQWGNINEAFTTVVRRLYELVQQMTGENAAAPESSPVNNAPKASSPINKLEREGAEAQLSLATQKQQRLQSALLLETDASRQFAYEQEIQKLETQIQVLKIKLQP